MVQGKKVQGYLLGMLSAACYGLNPLFAVMMYDDGIGVDSVLFYRYAFSTLLLMAMMWVTRTSFRVERHEILPILMMGTLFVLSSLFLFDSYNYMDVGIASTMLFVYPIMVALIGTLMFHEKISIPTIFSLGVCCVGVILLCQSGDGATVSLWGIMLVMLSSLSYAFYIIGINRSALKNYSSTKLTFYAILVGTVFLIVKLKFLTALDPISTLSSLSCGIGLAVLPTIVSLVAMAMAVKYIGATPAAILGSLEPVTGVAIGVFAFHEVLTSRSVLGILLIIAAVMLIIGEKRILNFISGRVLRLSSNRNPRR